MEKSIFDIIGEEIEKQGDIFQQKVNTAIENSVKEAIDVALKKAIKEWDQLWERSIRRFYYSINENGVPKKYKRQGGDQSGTNLYNAKVSDVSTNSEGRIADFSWRVSAENMMGGYRFHSADAVLNYIAVSNIRFKPPKGKGQKKRPKTMYWTFTGVKTDGDAFGNTYAGGSINDAIGYFNDNVEEWIVNNVTDNFYNSFIKFMKKEKLL